MSDKKKILLVDDQEVVREGLRMMFNNSKTITIAGEAGNGKEFLEMVDSINPDAIIMDINMPVMDGIEATRTAISRNPDLKILALSMNNDGDSYLKMAQAGAKGFILKSSIVSELEKAVMSVAENGFYTSEVLVNELKARISSNNSSNSAAKKIIDTFEEAERKAINLVSAGHSDEDIAKKLNISVDAAKKLRSKLLKKTGCNNSASLVMFAISNGLS